MHIQQDGVSFTSCVILQKFKKNKTLCGTFGKVHVPEPHPVTVKLMYIVTRILPMH